MKKVLFVFMVIFISSILVACGGYSPENNWVLEKSRLGEVGEIETYVTKLQNNSDTRGFKVFTISEGKKMVVVSSGNENKSLELDNVDIVLGDTKITLSESEKKNGENNPYIMVGLGAIEGELSVENVDGNSFEETYLGKGD
ncbi:hypothetical protein [Halobacillus naozhouensis]|uniref:Lipoprotein n=2 Tax=Halobacillus naozhouensis TaxID=554880 RepID=A0ABY8IZN5_9BACI|nr:hypothetical protein [Halobacillus naozhouensis]WFT74186.1 hypothetical protein P9989_17750 [Halobacillus naozhouensis]